MADVFLSYFNKDRNRVERIARLLEAQGITVWRDTTLRAGEHWGEVVERELAAARCIVVCWSEGALKSRWVREEANQGLKRNILVPLLLEQVEPPVGFQMIQAKDVSAWDGSSEADAARDVVNAVHAILLRPPVTSLTPPPPNSSMELLGSLGSTLLAVALVIAGGLGVYAFMRPAPAPLPQQQPKPQIVVPPQPTTADIARVWDQIKTEDSIALFEDFISDFGKHSTTYARLARNRIAKLKKDAAAKAADSAPVLIPPAKPPPTITPPEFKPWTFGSSGTPNTSAPATTRFGCSATSKDACSKLIGCTWDDKLGFFGGCKPVPLVLDRPLGNLPKPPGSDRKTSTSPLRTTCLAFNKVSCNKLSGCIWDEKLGANGCRRVQLSDLLVESLKPIRCGNWTTEASCKLNAPNCVWMPLGKGACLTRLKPK